MRCAPICNLGISILLLSLLAIPSRADELAEKGRQILKQNQHAVVTVEIVLKATYSSGGQTSTPRETKRDLTGTVVDPSGLTVLSLSTCDPGELLQRMMGGQSKYSVDTEISDLKILLDDGTELPAKVVLRDKDLDLAFIRPKTKPAKPMAAVDLSQAGSAQVLDEVIALNRLNRAASRAYAASVERISAIIQRPRKFYIPDSTMTTTTLGSPAFMLNGKVLGVFVMRALNVGGGQPYNSRENLTAIILPASDIRKAAEQAPPAKGDNAKPAKSKGSKTQPSGAGDQ